MSRATRALAMGPNCCSIRPQNLRPETTETARGHVRGAAGWLDGPSAEEMRPDDTFRLFRLPSQCRCRHWSLVRGEGRRPPHGYNALSYSPFDMDDEISSTPGQTCRDTPNGPS